MDCPSLNFYGAGYIALGNIAVWREAQDAFGYFREIPKQPFAGILGRLRATHLGFEADLLLWNLNWICRCDSGGKAGFAGFRFMGEDMHG